MKYLHGRKWLRKDDPGKKLVLAMDDCGGQDKNNVFLHLAHDLVEMGLFCTAEFGHTKNACDRTFNQMKLN
jgi:hypothetical protein